MTYIEIERDKEFTFSRKNAAISLISTEYLKAATWVYCWEKRMNENLEYTTKGLDKISLLKPAKFDYINGGKNQIRFITQDVQKIIPEAISVIQSEKDKGMLGLNINFIIPYLVNSIQELILQLRLVSNLFESEISKQKAEGEKTLSHLRELQREKLTSDNRVLALEKENITLKVEIFSLRKEVKTIHNLSQRLQTLEQTMMARK